MAEIIIEDRQVRRGSIKEVVDINKHGTIAVAKFIPAVDCPMYPEKENRLKVFKKGSYVIVIGDREGNNKVFVFVSGRNDKVERTGSKSYVIEWNKISDYLGDEEGFMDLIHFTKKGRRANGVGEYLKTDLGVNTWINSNLVEEREAVEGVVN